MRNNQKLYTIEDRQGQYPPHDVQAETIAKAKVLYSNYYNINPLVYCDRLKATLIEEEY